MIVRIRLVVSTLLASLKKGSSFSALVVARLSITTPTTSLNDAGVDNVTKFSSAVRETVYRRHQHSPTIDSVSRGVSLCFVALRVYLAWSHANSRSRKSTSRSSHSILASKEKVRTNR